MNSYFASVEQQANPFLRHKPIGVCGKRSPNTGFSQANERTVIAAASREAKHFGIKSGFGVWEAQRLCPQIILVPADYSKYQDTSVRIVTILNRYTDIVEIFSIDEAFLDLTHICKGDWDQAYKLMIQIKQDLLNQIGEWLTCSVGIAKNKMVAKLAGESKKPDGLTMVKPDNNLTFLFNQKLDDICGIGRKVKARLNSIGIYTLKELYETSLPVLRNEFGKVWGTMIWNMGQGEDSARVIPIQNLPEEKSFGHSYTLPRNLTNRNKIRGVLAKLCEKTGRRARLKNMKGERINFFVRFEDFTAIATEKKLHYYTNSTIEIFQTAQDILDQIPLHKPIRLIGVSLTNLIKERYAPQELWQTAQKQTRITKHLDQINDRYGDFTVYPAIINNVVNQIQNIPDGRNPKTITNALMKRFI